MTTAVSPSAPLWLELKTEYIDQNFENVLNYLYKESKNVSKKDAFYERTCELLSERVDILLDEISAFPVYSDEIDRGFAVRLIGAYVLISGKDDDMDPSKLLRCNIAILLALSALDYGESEGLLKMSVDILSGKRENNLQINWSDMLNFQPQILAYRLANQPVVKPGTMMAMRYEGKGVVTVSKDGVALFSATGRESDVKSLSILGGRINVMASKEDKVKLSEYDDIDRLHQFTADYVKAQRNFTTKPLKKYSGGDDVLVVVTGFGENTIKVESVDPRYEKFCGTIDVSEPILGYSKSDLKNGFSIGNYIEVTIEDAYSRSCSILESLSKYIVDDVAKDDFGGKVVLAVKVRSITDRKGTEKTMWLTDYGYCAHTLGKAPIAKDDFAEIKITNHGTDKYLAFINAEFIGSTEDTFDVADVRAGFLSDFVKDNPNFTKEESLHGDILGMLCGQMLLYYRTLSKPSEKYMVLCVSRILSTLLGKTSDSSYILFLQDYLRNIVLFANDEIDKMTVPQPDSDVGELKTVSRQLMILRILSGYGKSEKNQFLDEIIEEHRDDLTVKLASLVQSCNRLGDIVSRSVKSVVKSEIISSLSLDMKGEMDLEKETGKYLGMENEHQEFKTSFFYPPLDAKEKDQRLTVLRGVCAFLNSDAGGTLYLGVNDMGYVKGIEGDFKYMETHYTGNYGGMDGYVRYIIDTAKKYFEKEVLQYITVTPQYDGKVVAIEAKPYPYGVVKIGNDAFMRLNNETVTMNSRIMTRLLEKRISQDDGSVRTVGALQEAIRIKRRTILHGYRSSNSGAKSERHVEPFYIYPGFEYVCCYDVDKRDLRVFRIDRIGNAEVTDTPWNFENCHEILKMDIFHMTGKTPIHVVLRMDLMAKNLLCEEYPDAEQFLSQEDDSESSWLLTTDVYSIEGIGRFYIGLASNITIVSAPGLAEYVKDYASRYLL